MLLTLSSGVKGFTTIHAGSARQALTRLRFVCQLADSDLPTSALNHLVAEAIDLVVHTERVGNGIEVAEILAVEDLIGSADSVHFTVTELFSRTGRGQPLRWSGHVPVRLGRLLATAGVDVVALLEEGR